MKKFVKVFLALSYLVALVLTPLSSSKVLAAGVASMYLSPGAGSYTVGATFSVNIYENSGSTLVNAVQAKLSYPASLLSYEGVTSSVAYNMQGPSSGGGGNVNIVRGAQPAVSGNQLVATMSFKVLASGSAPVSFSAGSVVAEYGTAANILTGGTTGSSYNLSAPSPTPPAPPTPAPTPTPGPSPSPSSNPKSNPSPSPSSNPKSNPSPQPTAAPNAFSIDNVVVSSISYDTATINWHTSKAATSEVNVGQLGVYPITKVSATLVSDHSATLTGLTPGQLYHFIIKGSDASGQTASTSDATFHTKGATVTFTVLDQNNKPVAGALVTVTNGQGNKVVETYSATTDKLGVATLTDVPASQNSAMVLSANISYKGKNYKKEIQVQPISSGSTNQTKTVSIAVSPVIKPLYVVVAGGIALMALAAVVLKLLASRKLKNDDMNHHFPSLPSSNPSTPVPPSVNPSSGSSTSSSSTTEDN